MSKLDDNSIMPYGKYRGKKMIEVPEEYLIFLYEENKCSDEIKEYVEDNLDVLQFQINYRNKCLNKE
jgi:uncharacterized protein (DUF3820 family)